MTKPAEILKFCPRCGKDSFVYDGTKSFKCSSCQFHFFINSAAAVAVIIENEKKEICLTIRAFEPKKGFYDLPGGFVDIMETAEEAAVREIKEELNLEVQELLFIGSSPNEYVFSGYSVYTCDLGFVAKVKNFECMRAADDVQSYTFIPVNQIDSSLLASNSIAAIIQMYQERNI